jgi:muramoyltetrapeptide carboxypeptidase
MNYISPKRLQRGSKVAVVASAAPLIADEVTEGLDIMSEMGLVPVLGPNVKNLRTSDAVAATVEERVDELMWAFNDPKIDGIFEALGGVASALLLPNLDFDRIRASRKVFVGMSDISSLNNGILCNSYLINFCAQSPSIRLDKGERVRSADSKSFKHTIAMLMSPEEWGSKPFNISTRFSRCITPGIATGVSFGGNLDTFSRLLGSPYFPDPAGMIMFIEDVHKSGEVILRELVQLEIAGVIDELAGVVIGEFIDVPKMQDAKEPAIEDVLQDFFRGRLPCAYGFNFSHGPITCPIPIGAQTYLDAENGIVKFRFTMD